MEEGGGKSKALTPMMRQYQGMRKSLPGDVLLLFRLGDFYEMFFQDAVEAAGILNVALTKRNGIPMCGVPHHAARGYIAKLVQAGRRVALAEQKSEPKPGKIVDREIAHVISAGTIDDLDLLENSRHHYLAAVNFAGKRHGLAFLDLSTGDFHVAEFAGLAGLEDELARISPSEILYADDVVEVPGWSGAQAYDGYTFMPDQARDLLQEHFKVHSLDGFGCGGMDAAIGAAGAILHYLRYQLRRQVDHVRRLTPRASEGYVQIDAASQANLELVYSSSGAKHTLLAAMDRTRTPMGARLLRDWILHPLRDLGKLNDRQELIAAFVGEPWLLEKCREGLQGIRDIERTVVRLSQGSGNARDLLSLAHSLGRIPELRGHLEALPEGEAGGLKGRLLPRLRDFSELVGKILGAIAEEPPAGLKDGGIFRDGFMDELDELRAAARDGRRWIAQLQEDEARRTKIKSLKVRYNAVFGYFIEVTKANVHLVPEDYVRKQTTANSERYVTPALKEIEQKVLGADERAKALEFEVFVQMRSDITVYLEELQDTAAALARIDVLAGLAETARLYGYQRPKLNNSLRLVLVDGRHPVLDQTLVEEKFVPNDANLDGDTQRLILITGPNMAGKSTYIRQVALLILMAQTGSFLPVSAAEIGLVDRIFTRVGASDDLARGQSTFMVEMNETSLILNNATDRSLVILDEIGRGTSTFDGLSIAWAVAEYLHDVIGARALFATHYHELTRLANSRKGIRNYNVAVREWNDRIIFLRKIVEGSADRSYGIQVARLAGLPAPIIQRAKAILNHLEANATTPRAVRRQKVAAVEGGEDEMPESEQPQLGLFD